MSADIGSTSLPPEEAAFHAAWLGKLWPRYRRLFEGGGGRRTFEWRAALYPLWLGIPGLNAPLNAVIAVTLVMSFVIVQDTPGWAPLLAVLVAGMQLALWPVLAGALLYGTLTGEETALFALWPLGMIAISVAAGMLAPRLIVAEGRRRWRQHAARVAAGETPALPRAVTAPSAARLVVLVVLAAAGIWVVFRVPQGGQGSRSRPAAMKSDLRSLISAEESYFADNQRYTADMSALNYEFTSGVTLRILTASDSGWSAEARHEGTTQTCAVFVGAASPPIEGAVEGEPRCTR